MANNMLQTVLVWVTLTFWFKTLFNGVGSNLGVAMFVFLILFFFCIVFFLIVFFPFFLFSSFLTAETLQLSEIFAITYFELLYMIELPLWDTVSMNLAQNKCCTPLKKFGHITPLPAHNGRLSTSATFSVPKVAVMESFNCSISQRQKTWHCILTFLWLNSLKPRTVRLVLKTFSVFSTITLIRMLNSCNIPPYILSSTWALASSDSKSWKLEVGSGRKQDFITRTSAEVFRGDLVINIEIMSLFYDNVKKFIGNESVEWDKLFFSGKKVPAFYWLFSEAFCFIPRSFSAFDYQGRSALEKHKARPLSAKLFLCSC